MLRKIYLSLLFSGILLLSYAQDTQDGRVDRGNKHFYNYAYQKAIEKYLASSDESIETLRSLAESYYKTQQYKEAEELYAVIVNDESASIDDLFNYVSVLKKNQKYAEAQNWMEIFATQYPNDLRSKSFRENIEIDNLLEDNGQFTIEHLGFNSDQQDFAPVYFQGKIVFTSSRTKMKYIKREWNWNQLPFLSLYETSFELKEMGSSEWTEPNPFLKKMNKKFHDGPISFNSDFTKLYLTRNNYDNTSEEGIIKLQLFTSNLIDGEWSELEAFPYNSSEYSVAHASLSSDGK